MFAVGASFSFRGRVGGQEKAEKLQRGDDLLRKVGWGILATGLGMTVYSIVSSGGAILFEIAYLELFDSLFSSSLFSYGVMLTAEGVFVLALGVKQNAIWYVIGCQGAITCVLLAFGDRTGGLIPLLGLVLIMGKRGIRMPWPVIAGGLVALLFIIAVVRVTREGGVANAGGEAIAQASPVVGLLEMGGSLETVALAFEWIDNGDHLQLGGSYWLPFERAIGRLVPGIRTDIEYDPRAMSEVLTSRAGGLGGSVVGESYYNFGILGASVFFFPLGYLIGRMDCADTPMSNAFYISILYAFFFQVRNYFTPVPVMIFVGAAPLIAANVYRATRRYGVFRRMNMRHSNAG
jgi:hypothetical protein